MFEYKYKVPKSEFKTTYGSICIENIVFEPDEIERVLPNIVFEDENLKHMFAEDNLNQIKRKNIYLRFAPKIQFILQSINCICRIKKLLQEKLQEWIAEEGSL